MPEGVKLFTLFARDCPEHIGCDWHKIGYIGNTSKLTESDWGDKKLFFQHHMMEEDIEVRPQYEQWLMDDG